MRCFACKNSDELLIWLIAWKIYIQNLLLILSSCSSSHNFVYAAWDAFHHMGNLRQLTSWYNRCWCCMLALLCSFSVLSLPHFLTRMCYCRNLVVTDWTRLDAVWVAGSVAVVPAQHAPGSHCFQINSCLWLCMPNLLSGSRQRCLTVDPLEICYL